MGVLGSMRAEGVCSVRGLLGSSRRKGVSLDNAVGCAGMW